MKLGVVQVVKQKLPLVMTQHVQLFSGCLRMHDSLPQQRFILLRQPLHVVFCKEIRIVVKLDEERIVFLPA